MMMMMMTDDNLAVKMMTATKTVPTSSNELVELIGKGM